jgi:hypothetical protein
MKIRKVNLNQGGMVHWILPVVVVVILAAVGVRLLTVSNASSLTPTIPTPVTVTNVNNGQTVFLPTIGQRLIVELNSITWSNISVGTVKTDQTTWHNFSSSNTKVLKLVGTTTTGYLPSPDIIPNTPTYRSSTQFFIGSASGQSIVIAQASSSPACNLKTVCPAWAQQNNFKVTIIVGKTR